MDMYLPNILRLSDETDRQLLEALLADQNVCVFDEMWLQLKELVKCKKPSQKLNDQDYDMLIQEHLNGLSLKEYGVWVFYPWSKRLVHLLDEEEFIAVRTNRNRNKITSAEQEELRSRKIGVVGLSVGQSIAMTLVQERTCGEIRLADFDTAELSNLNRIRTGVHNMGVNKTIIAAREIAELDPFIRVKIFPEGLNPENMESFFEKDDRIDLLVEVCDGIQVKIDSRLRAKQLQIPVVMDTNDRGMMDIERFDLEPERPILHGKLDDHFVNGELVVTDLNRAAVVNSILTFDSLSERMKLSMTEINKTINAWPQLASSVVLGGAITTDICRKILLKQHSSSGRYYVDLDEIFAQEQNG